MYPLYTPDNTAVTPVLSSACPLCQYTFPAQQASLAIVSFWCGGGGRCIAEGFLLEQPDAKHCIQRLVYDIKGYRYSSIGDLS